MAQLDITPILRQINERHLEMFKEQIRQLQEAAWKEGYIAADNGRDENTNPYSKENDNARSS